MLVPPNSHLLSIVNKDGDQVAGVVHISELNQYSGLEEQNQFLLFFIYFFSYLYYYL